MQLIEASASAVLVLTGLAVSAEPGRAALILSSDHRHWSEASVRRIAHRMWRGFELVPGRTAGVFHVLTDARSSSE